MQQLIKKLQERKFELDQSSFCCFLKDSNIPAETRLRFAPEMFFFVLGFRDMLFSLENYEDESEYQKMVNVHCKEDSHHWRWYLNDLEYLKEKGIIDFGSLTEHAHEMWSQSNWHTRNTVYEVLHISKTLTNPFMKLVVIQALEATFDSFNDGMTQVITDLNLLSELTYYGNLHVNAEEDHEGEDWMDLDPNDESHRMNSLSEEEREEALRIIDSVMDAFYNMFNSWFSSANSKLNTEFEAA